MQGMCTFSNFRLRGVLQAPGSADFQLTDNVERGSMIVAHPQLGSESGFHRSLLLVCDAAAGA